ncbi:hypothetical protein L7F22_036285 [Adiantum nelumboides]|nr:hypothetical protein [Adiantum nelumboides]
MPPRRVIRRNTRNFGIPEVQNNIESFGTPDIVLKEDFGRDKDLKTLLKTVQPEPFTGKDLDNASLEGKLADEVEALRPTSLADALIRARPKFSSFLKSNNQQGERKREQPYYFESSHRQHKFQNMARRVNRSEVQSEYKISLTQREVERIRTDVEKMRSDLRYEIDKVTAAQRLDINLERGRTRDDLAKQSVETSELTNKLDREIHALKTQVEAAKYEVIKYGIGTIVSLTAVGLGLLRILM